MTNHYDLSLLSHYWVNGSGLLFSYKERPLLNYRGIQAVLSLDFDRKQSKQGGRDNLLKG